MSVLSIDHFEKLEIGPYNSVIGILQRDSGSVRRNVTYLLDSELVSANTDICDQRPLYHSEFLLDNPDGDEENPPPVKSNTYRLPFYNLYDVCDTAGKTMANSRIFPAVEDLWKLDTNSNQDNYCPVLVSDPVGFTGKKTSLFVLTKPTHNAPLIKTTDLLFSRSELSTTDKVTATEWSYQISSSTSDSFIPTYGYAPLSALDYPGLHVPISSMYIYVDGLKLCSAVSKLPADTTVAGISGRINANDATDSQLGELTANFGERWQEGIVAGYGNWPGAGGMTLCAFYNATVDYQPSYKTYVQYMGGDPGISTLLVNKFNFSGLDYNYIYWTRTDNKPNQFTAGEVWFDLLYGKNSYTSRYSQQFAPDGNSDVHPGDFNRARDYSGIGVGGGFVFLKYYDDMNYESDGDISTVVRESDFSTTETKKPGEGDTPQSNPLHHVNDLSSSQMKTQRSYPHIEQLREMNVMVNQSMHPSNLYKIELGQRYLKEMFRGIEQNDPANGIDINTEIRTNIRNSIREIARKFAPATTELLTVEFPS